MQRELSDARGSSRSPSWRTRRAAPKPDVSSLHADIVGHRSGAEVTFTGVVVSDPTNSDGHERMLVLDQLGDTLELVYNTSLGRSVPVHAGQSVVVHGQPRRM